MFLGEAAKRSVASHLIHTFLLYLMVAAALFASRTSGSARLLKDTFCRRVQFLMYCFFKTIVHVSFIHSP